MAGIDSSGLTIKRFEDIKSDLESSLRGYFGNSIDLTDNAILGIINTIYANSLTEQWEMSQAVYNAFNIDVATGKQLDDLVALVGLSRLGDAATTGILEVTALNNTTIPIGTEFKTSDNNVSLYTDSALTVTNASCARAELDAVTVSVGEVYTLSVNSSIYTYTAIGGDTKDDVLAALRDAVSVDSNASWSADFTIGDAYLTVSADSNALPLAIVVSSNISFGNITSVVSVSAGDVGAISVYANTVTVVPMVAGIISSNNPSDLSTGRLSETDDELRLRHSVSTTILGSSSSSSILSAVRAIKGVLFAEIFENTTIVPDHRGLPAKSFEIVIDGGSDTDISQTIYNVKPAGIEAHGGTLGFATDGFGNAVAIRYTRPTSVGIYIDVVYSLYSEEMFPTNGEALIRSSIESYISGLSLGEDVIAQRLFGDIYRSVGGIANLDIKLGVSNNDITKTLIPIAASDRASLNILNISLGSI